MDAAEVLTDARRKVVDEAYTALRRSQSAHYLAAGEEFTRQRLADLFGLVVTGVRDRELTHVVEYAEGLARERFEAGFDFVEVQTAFNALEEAMWRRLLTSHLTGDLVDALAALSTVLGAGKDALARTYVSLATRRHVPSLDLTALFRGASA